MSANIFIFFPTHEMVLSEWASEQLRLARLQPIERMGMWIVDRGVRCTTQPSGMVTEQWTYAVDFP